MSYIIGVRFRNAGRSYYYDPGDLEIHMGDHVIVESAGAIEYGTVSIPHIEMDDEKLTQTPLPVIRVATEDDERIIAENKEKEKESLRVAKEKVREHGLDMKVVQTEYAFERNKILFYFTAEGRVDFRNLVKDLAAVFKTRIELRQIGVRDETRVLGGLGICGRELCCKSFLNDFAPVSIKMAKEQNLSLNPTKISGVCGRLMCCLNNEAETYEYLNKQMPGKGDGAVTEDGEEGVVTGLNVLRQKVTVLFEENDSREIREYDVADLTFIPRKKRLAMLKEREENAAKGKHEKPDQRESEPKKERVLKSVPANSPEAAEEAGVTPEGESRKEDKPQEKGHRDNRDNQDKPRRERFHKDKGNKKDNRENRDHNKDFHEKEHRDKDHRDKGRRGKEGKKERDFRDKKSGHEKRDKGHGSKDMSKRNGGYRPFRHRDEAGGGEES